MRLAELIELGFDLSERSKGSRSVEVACSCCQALVINGRPNHEQSCPNEKHECAGCGGIIPRRERYCADCSY